MKKVLTIGSIFCIISFVVASIFLNFKTNDIKMENEKLVSLLNDYDNLVKKLDDYELLYQKLNSQKNENLNIQNNIEEIKKEIKQLKMNINDLKNKIKNLA